MLKDHSFNYSIPFPSPMPFGLKTKNKKTPAQHQIKTSSIRASIHNVITILQSQQKAGKHLASVNETYFCMQTFSAVLIQVKHTKIVFKTHFMPQ